MILYVLLGLALLALLAFATVVGIYIHQVTRVEKDLKDDGFYED